MSKWCDSTCRYAAAHTLVAALLFGVACGPQTVPYPVGPRPSQGDAGVLRPGNSSAAGAKSSTAGRVAPSASGRDAPAFGSAGVGSGVTTAQPGAAGAPVVVTPGGALAAQGGSGAPPVSVGGSRGIDVPSNGAAGVGGAIAPTEPPVINRPPFEAGTDPNRNNVQPGMLCARIAAVQCAGEAHCCSMPKETVQSCEAELTSACANMLYLDMIAANPVTGFDPVATKAMLDELEQRSSQCDVDIGTWFIGPQGLRGILKGTLGANASCKPPGADALADKPALAAALGSCQNIETHACLPRSVFGVWSCAERGGLDSGCATDDNCLQEFYCEDPDPIGKCAQKKPLGAECTDGSTECSSLYCKGGVCVAADVDVAFCLK